MEPTLRDGEIYQKKTPEAIREEMEDYTRMEQLRSTLMVHRAPYQDTWEQMQRFLDPHMVIWSPSTSGFPDFDDIKISSYPFQAFDDLVAGLQTGITPENQEWHLIEPESEDLKTDEQSLEWCHRLNELYRWTFNNSNFHQETPVFYRSASKFLTAAMMVEEDFETRCRFTTFPIGSYYCSNNGQGLVDTFIYETRLKLRQIVDLFCTNVDGEKDLSNLGDNLLSAWRDPDQHESPWNVVFCIEPNPEFNKAKAKYDSQYQKYRCTYYERDSSDKRILQRKGFAEFPVPTFRWFRQPTDAYGVDGPGRKALGDTKEMYKATGMWDLAVEKVIEPPMVAPPGTGQYPMGTTPGFLVNAPGASHNQTGFRPAYQIQPDMKAIQDKRMELKACIDKSTYADVFRMLANDDRKTPATATEIMNRIQENYNILAPMYGNFEHDWLKRIFKIMFYIFLRQGAFLEGGIVGPPPPQLTGQPLKTVFVSRIAMALKLVETTAFDKVLGYIDTIAKTHPEVWDVVDIDEMVRRYFISNNVPAKIIRDPRIVQAIRTQKAQAAQQAQAMEHLDTAASAARDLSETKPQDGSLLQKMLPNTANQ